MSYQPMAPPAPAPATAPVTPSSRAKIRPSAAWYWIGGVLIALGVIGFFVVLSIWFLRASDAVDKFARVIVPPEGAQADLQFKKGGEYTLYYEYRSEVDGQRVNNSDHDTPSELAVTITDPNGANIPVRPYTNDFSVSVNDKLGPAFGKMNIPAPGTYTMKITSTASAPFVVAIGKGVLQSVWPWWILGALAVFVIGVGLGLFSIISTAVKRGRRKRDLRRGQQRALGAPLPAYAGAAAAAGSGPGWSTPPPPPGWGSPGSGAYPPPPADRPVGQTPDEAFSAPTPGEQPARPNQPASGWATPSDRLASNDQPAPSDRSAPSGWASPGENAATGDAPAAGSRPSSGEWPSPADRPPSGSGAGEPDPAEPPESTGRSWGPPQR
jgi:hypothetical protein